MLAYFASIQLSKNPGDEISLRAPFALDEQFESNPLFADFWEHIHEIYPEKSDHFRAIVDEGAPYDYRWFENKYDRFLYEDEFNRISENERRQLQEEFEAKRLGAYQIAVKGEALRLNCKVSDVRSDCPVLPVAPNENEVSRFVDFPNAIFGKIMNWLETVDVFRVTLVCKKWRDLVYNNPMHLRRAEHAKTTHLITFIEWMDPANTQHNTVFEEKYLKFSLGLLKLCWQVTDHLEKVILPRLRSFLELKSLLQSCPNLKNLQIVYSTEYVIIDDERLSFGRVQLENWEFYCSYLRSFNYMSELNMRFLLSCESLRYFGGQLDLSRIPRLDTRNRMQHAFENLVALDLVSYTIYLLDILASVDDLKLRYFRVGYRHSSEGAHGYHFEEARSRDLLDKIVGKLNKLEIFIASHRPGIGNRTIRVLTESQLNLKMGSFAGYFNFYDNYGRDDWDSDVLVEFRNMLLSNNPELDLSQFCFVVMEDMVLEQLKELNIGFTLYGGEDVVISCRFKLIRCL